MMGAGPKGKTRDSRLDILFHGWAEYELKDPYIPKSGARSIPLLILVGTCVVKGSIRGGASVFISVGYGELRGIKGLRVCS